MPLILSTYIRVVYKMEWREIGSSADDLLPSLENDLQYGHLSQYVSFVSHFHQQNTKYLSTLQSLLMKTTSWNSTSLEITYEVLGWVAFSSWVLCSYPQVYLNFRRKSVVGLNFDFVLMNLTKQICYLTYNTTLYFSASVQKQYHQKYGLHEMIPVAANDVAFTIHAVLMCIFILVQIVIYDRGDQKFSKIALAVIFVAWLSAGVCIIIALPTHAWLWLISVFNIIQVIMTFIKYMPQAYMNFSRKSTLGFSIGFVLLDLLGGTTNIGQMAIQSIDQGSWVNFYGNMGKLALCVVCIGYGVIFICQHYLLYRHEDPAVPRKRDWGGEEPLT